MIWNLFVKTASTIHDIREQKINYWFWPVDILLITALSGEIIALTTIAELVEVTLALAFAVLVYYVVIHHLLPFILKKISRMVGGVGSKADMRIVLSISLISILPSAVAETITFQISEYFQRTYDLLSFFGTVFQIKFLIIGLSIFNQFSVKHAAMVLIILYAASQVIWFIR